MGVGVRKISREATTGPRKKIVMMISFRQSSPSLALRLPEWEAVRHMGFGVRKDRILAGSSLGFVVAFRQREAIFKSPST
jgi:hypothetical protein